MKKIKKIEKIEVTIIYNKLNPISRMAIKLIKFGGWLFEKSGGKEIKNTKPII